MTTLALNNIVSPLANFWSSLNNAFTIIGYSRAAAELARLGYYEESKNLMMQVKELKK